MKELVSLVNFLKIYDYMKGISNNCFMFSLIGLTMRNLFLFLFLVSIGSSFAVEIKSGELWHLYFSVTEGEVSFDRELYALAAPGNLLIAPGMIGEYECNDSGIVLHRYRDFAVTFDGKASRKVLAESMKLYSDRVYREGDSTTSWVVRFEKVTMAETVKLTDLQGFITTGIRDSRLAILCGDTLYAHDRDVYIKHHIVSKSGNQIEIIYKNGSIEQKCIDLTNIDGSFFTTSDTGEFLKAVAPLRESAPMSELIKISKVDMEEVKKDTALGLTEMDYRGVLQNFIYNNYNLLDTTAMRALRLLVDYRFESCTYELMLELSKYCGKSGISIENAGDVIDKRMRRKRIKIDDDDPDRITKGLYLLYLKENVKPRGRDQKRLLGVLGQNVIHYTRSEL